MTIGVRIFGSIQSKLLSSNLSNRLKDLGAEVASGFSNSNVLSKIFEPAVREQIPSNILDVIISAMSHLITHIYLLALIPVGIAFMFFYLMDNARETGIGFGLSIVKQLIEAHGGFIHGKFKR